MQNIHDPNHPMWNILMHSVWLLATLAALWLFSSTFDETELKALATIIGAVLAAGGAKQFVIRQAAQSQQKNG